MRLTCPNCAAQYEVPDDVIPEEGRDVQCSSCGTTWFQPAAGASAEPPVAEDTAPEPEGTPEVSEQVATEEAIISEAAAEEIPSPEHAPHVEEEQIPEAAEDLTTSEELPAEEEDEPEEPAPAPDMDDEAERAARRQRGLDPALSDILREEAEREASLRAASAPAQGLESQPNLGLDDLPENEQALRARQAKDRMARIKGQDPRQLAAEASGQRRGVLPDIEEINSTLRAGDAAAVQAAAEDTPVPRKSGFARGFALTILLALILMMIYTNAAKIAEAVPQADPYLSSYVTWVDQARLWLDAQVKALQTPQP